MFLLPNKIIYLLLRFIKEKGTIRIVSIGSLVFSKFFKPSFGIVALNKMPVKMTF